MQFGLQKKRLTKMRPKEPCLPLVSIGSAAPTAEHFYVAVKRSALLGTAGRPEVVSGGVALSAPDWKVHGQVLLAARAALPDVGDCECQR